MRHGGKIALLLILWLILCASLRALTFPNAACHRAFQYFVDRNLNALQQVVDSLLQQEPEAVWPNLLKVLYLTEQGGTANRVQAMELLQAYAPTYRKDPFAFFVRGYFLKKGHAPGLSRHWLQKALELDPYFVEALVELGEAYRQEMLDYQHRWTNTDVAFSMEPYAEEAFEKARYYLQRALNLRPDHFRARYLLGLLYYDHGNRRKMMRLFEQGIALHPARPEWYLWLGLAFQEQGEYAEASQYFDQALARMPDSVRALFTDVQVLQNEFLGNDYLADLRDWTQLDPLYLSRENERLTEHLARLAYVQLKFSVPALNIPGWKTDRGQVYLHFGKPRQIIRFGKTYSDLGTILPPAEIWVYPQFSLMFEDEFWNGNYRFAVPTSPLSKSPFRSRSMINYEWVADEVYREFQEFFDFQLPGGRFDFDWEFACFRNGETNKTEVMFFLDIPLRQFPVLDSLELETGLFVRRDETSIEQKYYAVVEPFQQLEHIFPYRQNLYLTGRFTGDPGTFFYSLEIREHSNQMVSVQRDSLTIASFPADQLAISDIVLARQLTREPRNLPSFRNGFYLEPAIDHRFSQKNLMFIYFEIYFLQKASDNKTLYLVENTLIPKEKGAWWQNWMMGKQSSISIVNEYQGNKTHDFVVQALRLDHVEPGEYWVQIRVTDRYSGQQVQKRVALIVEAK
ncbi:MAG: GWxTD domain-containing protein [Calditrichaeota bacterium]|nr:GWxTD domain-containing protein [Calditrichota bacterium]